jgi:hypothetical protein
MILLGYVLAPNNPAWNDREILEPVLQKSSSLQEITSAFYELAGRYVCFVSLDNALYAFSDTLGFRSLYYYESQSCVWCASQPSILAEIAGLQQDTMIVNDLSKIKHFNDGTEYWYPGQSTPFKGVYHVLPNHYLDLNKRNTVRYWPDKTLEQHSCEECVPLCAYLLEQIMKSAATRFDLEIAVTAGLDSRMVLAGSRSISENAVFFTHTHPRLNEHGKDITVPSALLKANGLNHTVVHHAATVDPDFNRVFKRNVFGGRPGKCINAFTMYSHFQETGKERVIVHGVPGEIARNFFYLPPGVPLSADILAVLSRMSESNIVLEEFDHWLRNAAIPAFKYNMRTLDLFYWEQRIGNWAAMSYNEYDIAFESFTPFSCRKLLTTMLGVESKFRVAPGHLLQKEIIRQLWPELLFFPINPPTSIAGAIHNSLRSSPVYTLYKSLAYLNYSSLCSSKMNSLS